MGFPAGSAAPMQPGPRAATANSASRVYVFNEENQSNGSLVASSIFFVRFSAGHFGPPGASKWCPNGTQIPSLGVPKCQKCCFVLSSPKLHLYPRSSLAESTVFHWESYTFYNTQFLHRVLFRTKVRSKNEPTIIQQMKEFATKSVRNDTNRETSK